MHFKCKKCGFTFDAYPSWNWIRCPECSSGQVKLVSIKNKYGKKQPYKIKLK